MTAGFSDYRQPFVQITPGPRPYADRARDAEYEHYINSVDPAQRVSLSAFDRCVIASQAAFGPSGQRRMLRERADFWSSQGCKSGSVERLRTLLVHHRSYWRRDAGYYTLRSSRLWIMVEIRKLRATRTI